MKKLDQILISGKQVLPLIEGGKGISVSNGQSAGAWAASGGVGTFSGAFADYYDEKGNFVPLTFISKNRRDRSKELVAHSIKAGIAQAKIAHDLAGGQGRIHMNILWGLNSVETMLHGILEQTPGLIHGVTCGAGMPFNLGEIAAKYQVYYYPIVSSARAFNLLWKRSYTKFSDWLGGVVYEDPWKAGGHNGLSNVENPHTPESPYERVKNLRKVMSEFNLGHVPIIMAGGVWFLREWQEWLDNPELGPIAFQFGTRPLLTVESPIPGTWKSKLTALSADDVMLNHFSPTGFYSSAVNNQFLQRVRDRFARQIKFYTEKVDEKLKEFKIGRLQRTVYINENDVSYADELISNGYNKILKTPDTTLLFLTAKESQDIQQDQVDCAGCLAYCRFSNWSEHEEKAKDCIPDPRSYCIRKTLYNIAHQGDVETELMFAGHSAYLFAQDPFYKNGFIPTVKQLIERIITGD